MTTKYRIKQIDLDDWPEIESMQFRAWILVDIDGTQHWEAVVDQVAYTDLGTYDILTILDGSTGGTVDDTLKPQTNTL